LSSVAVVRFDLDNLLLFDICFMPYEEHRQTHPFDWISLFSGFIRCQRWRHMHLPERVLRQYGFVQMIPRHPSLHLQAD